MSRSRLRSVVAMLIVGVVSGAPGSAGAGEAQVIACPDGSSGFSFPAGTVVKGDVVVRPGIYCSLLGVTVRGDVHAQPGAAYLAVDLGTVIKGNVTGSEMPSVVLQTARIKGFIELHNISDVVNMVGPVVEGDVEVTASSIVVLFSSEVKGDATFNGNQTVIVGDNRVRGTLNCAANVTVSLPQPNTVRGGAFGQCATL